ncbi:MAG: DUF4249 family protein [Bacteroidetes bacterium]|nr:DUF4249 family protein [Bacteroidota bacterium]MCY4233463.1 DUF4249 family protein [Bacteroidota bacterium]
MPVRIRILLIALLIGCETIVDVEIPGGYESKLIVTSHFSSDSLWTIEVSKSIPLRDDATPSDLKLSDAQIIISGEGSFRDSLHQIDLGLYQTNLNHYPVKGVTYKVDVTVDGFPSASATSRVPSLASELLSVDRIQTEGASEPERYTLRVRLVDLPENNYYKLNVYQAVPICRDSTGGLAFEDNPNYSLAYDFLTFESKAPSFHEYIEAVDDPTIPDIEDEFITAYFSDELFESTTRDFEIIFEPMTLKSVNPYFMLKLTAFSDESFAYERSVELHELFLEIPNLLQTSNRLTVYTNIENGLGIFAGSTSDKYWFDANGNTWMEDIRGIGQGEIQPCL